MNRLKLLLVAALVMLLAGCRPQAHAQPKETIRIGILQVPDDVAIARQRGYFAAWARQHHVRIQYVPFDSGVDANKALMSGAVDAASMGDTNALVALSAGIDVRLVWLNSVIGDNEALVAKPGIHSIQDLRGKTIATPFASTSHYSLMMVLKKAGLLHHVTLLDMDTQDIVAAWQRGNIDAAYTWQPTLSALTKTGTVLTDSEAQAQAGNTTANVMLFRTAFLRDHPALAQGVLSVLNRAHQLYQAHPQVALAAAAKQTGLTTKQAQQQVGSSTMPTAKQQRTLLRGEFLDALQRTGQFEASQQTIARAPSRRALLRFIEGGK